MAIVVKTSEEFVHEVLDSDIPVLVDFGATWCGPCKSMLPEVEAVERGMGGHLKVVQIDVEESPRLADLMGIRSLPTLMVFNGGEAKLGAMGARNRVQIRKLIEKALSL